MCLVQFWLLSLSMSRNAGERGSSPTSQPPPQPLRFSQGNGERLVMSRKGPWEGYRRQSLSPSCLPLRAYFHRERDVWVQGSPTSPHPHIDISLLATFHFLPPPYSVSLAAAEKSESSLGKIYLSK